MRNITKTLFISGALALSACGGGEGSDGDGASARTPKASVAARDTLSAVKSDAAFVTARAGFVGACVDYYTWRTGYMQSEGISADDPGVEAPPSGDLSAGCGCAFDTAVENAGKAMREAAVRDGNNAGESVIEGWAKDQMIAQIANLGGQTANYAEAIANSDEVLEEGTVKIISSRVPNFGANEATRSAVAACR